MGRQPLTNLQPTLVRTNTSSTATSSKDDSSSGMKSPASSRLPVVVVVESSNHKFLPLRREASSYGESSTSSSSSGSSALESVSSHRIRSRYFQKLGVMGGPPCVVATKLAQKRKQPSARPAPTFTEVLKDDLGHEDDNLTALSPPQHSKYNKESKVGFQAQVSVYEIPHRNQYSSEIRERLWMTPKELEQAAYRNCIEFTAEDWDWRRAVEEPDFCLIQGVWTHPAHALLFLQEQQRQQRFNPNRQFCMIFSAQQQQQRHLIHNHHHHGDQPHLFRPYPTMRYR